MTTKSEITKMLDRVAEFGIDQQRVIHYNVGGSYYGRHKGIIISAELVASNARLFKVVATNEETGETVGNKSVPLNRRQWYDVQDRLDTLFNVIRS